jgi:hypothetical protein
MVPRQGQHRLSHRFRHELLQRPLQLGSRTGGSALNADHHRDLSQKPARSVALARTRPWARGHDCGSPATISPGASGMDAVADGALGTDHWSTHGASVRADSRRQATPGDGLPVLPRHHPACGSVLSGSRGSRGRTGVAYGSMPLSERQVDSEELARRASGRRSAHHRRHPRTTTSVAQRTSSEERQC